MQKASAVDHAERKANAVLALLSGEQSEQQICIGYQIDPQTLQQWKTHFLRHAAIIFADPIPPAPSVGPENTPLNPVIGARLEVLQAINTHISAALSLPEILQITLTEGLRAIRTTEGSVMLVNPMTQELEIQAWIVAGEFELEKKHNNLKLGEGIAGHVIATGKPYYVQDTATDQYFVASKSGRHPRSLLCVPIISHGRILGVINTDNTEPRFFRAADIQFLSALAGHAALAIEAYRLRDVGSALANLTLDDVLPRIAESACILTGSEWSTIFVCEDNSDIFKVVAYPPEFAEDRPRGNDGLTTQILKSGEPLIVTDAQQDPRVRSRVQKRGVRSLMGVPLKMQTNHGVITSGVLFVNRIQERPFSERDVRLLDSIVGPAVVAIENAQLFERSKRMVTQLTELQMATAKMQSELGLSALLNLIAEQAAKLLGADSAGILLLDDNKQYLRFHGTFGLGSKARLGTNDRVGASIAGRVVAQGVPIVANDIPNDPRFYNPAAEAEHFLAIISTPMWRGDEIIGTLDIHSKSKRFAFTEDDLAILSLMARHAEVAIEKARLFQQNEILMNSAIDAILVVDETNQIVRVNKKAEQMLHASANQLVGQPGQLLYQTPGEVDHVRQMLLTDHNGKILEYDTYLKSTYGEQIPVRLSASLIYDYQGKRAGSVSFFRDLREIESVKGQVRTLNALLEASQVITSQLDLTSLLEAIPSEALNVLPEVDAVVLYPYDSQRHTLQAPPILKARAEIAPDLRNHLLTDLTVANKLMGLGKAHFVKNLLNDPILAQHGVLPTLVASGASVPLRVGDKVVGVLLFCYWRTHIFLDEEKSFINLLGNQAAIALENAQLYSDLRFQSIVIGATAWAADIAHTINREVGRIRQRVYLLSQEPYLSDENRRRLEEVKECAKQLAGAIDRATFSREGATVVALDKLLPVWMQQTIEKRSFAVEVRYDLAANAVTVYASPQTLARVIDSLVRNALDAFHARSGARLVIRTRQLPEQEVEIQIEDNGAGINPEIRRTLFYEPISDKGEGRGLGLLLSRVVVEQMGGTLRLLTSEVGKGSIFALTLPMQANARRNNHEQSRV